MQRTGSQPRTTSQRGTPFKRLALGFGIGGVLVLVTLVGKLYLSPAQQPTAARTTASTSALPSEMPAKGIRLPSLMDGLDGALEADAVPPSERPRTQALPSKRIAKGPLSSDDATSPMQLAVTLMVTIVAIVGVIWVVAKLLKSTRLAPGNERVLHMVDSLPLGAKRHVWVVGFRDRTLILGGGGEEVRLLAEYSDDEWSEHADALEAEEAPATQRPILEVLPQAPARTTAASTDSRPASRPAASEPTPQLSVEEPAVTFQLSAQAKAKAASSQLSNKKPSGRDSQKAQKAQKRLPPGAHRVPAAFRHLLEEPGVMDESSS